MKLGLISLNNGSNRRKQMHSQEDERNFQARGQAWIPSSKRICSLTSFAPNVHVGNYSKTMTTPSGKFPKKTPWKQLFGGKSTLLKL